MVCIGFDDQDMGVPFAVDFPFPTDEMSRFIDDFAILSHRNPHLTMNDLRQLKPPLLISPAPHRFKTYLFILDCSRRSNCFVHLLDDVLHLLRPYFRGQHQLRGTIDLQHQFPLILLQRRNEIIQRLLTHRCFRNAYACQPTSNSSKMWLGGKTLLVVVVFDKFAGEIGDEVAVSVEPRLIKRLGIPNCLF